MFKEFLLKEWLKIIWVITLSVLVATLEVYIYSQLPGFLLNVNHDTLRLIFLSVFINLLSVFIIVYISAVLASRFAKYKIYEMSAFEFDSEVVIKDLEKVSVNILLPFITISSRLISALVLVYFLIDISFFRTLIISLTISCLICIILWSSKSFLNALGLKWVQSFENLNNYTQFFEKYRNALDKLDKNLATNTLANLAGATTRLAALSASVGLLPKFIIEFILIAGITISLMLGVKFETSDLVFLSLLFKLLTVVQSITSLLFSIRSNYPSLIVLRDVSQKVKNKDEMNFKNVSCVISPSEREDGLFADDHVLSLNLPGKTLYLKKGELVIMSGASGVGKTTLLRHLYHEAIASGSSCLLLSQELVKPKLTQFEMQIFANRVSTKILCSKLGISESAKVFDKFSGGEWQRLLNAYAMSSDCDVIFMDEPAKGLDDENIKIFYQLLKINGSEQIYIITSHDGIGKGYASASIHLKI